MKKILLLDDNFEIVMMLRTIVTQMGYSVRSATDGPSALQVLSREAIDLIITDQRMPGMTGTEFIQKAREDGYKGCILMLTAFPQMTKGINLKELGIDRMMIKPIQIAELEETLESMLAEHAATQDSPSA